MEEFLTYDDVLLTPEYSEVIPSEVSLESRFSRRIPLHIPIVSSAMDTVTEAATAIVMAQEGGVGIIHKNLDSVAQAQEILKVKKYESGVILDPVKVSTDESLEAIVGLMQSQKISGVPVVDKNGLLVGIITNRDLRFEQQLDKKVCDVMTKNLVTAPVGTSLEEAKKILHLHRIEKLPLVNDKGELMGLITVKDIQKLSHFPHANKDQWGRLRVGAAVGVGDHEYLRAELLIKNFVDVLVVDTAHGHSRAVIEMVASLKQRYPHIDIVAGNVATAKATKDLISAGADGVKVGIGPGSICTTRVVAGVGVPQLSAVMKCAEEARSADVPIIADGGLRFSGDMVKALAAGASCCMVGGLLAGTDESPGERIVHQGRSYKVYRGMGSLGAMKRSGGRERYSQGDVKDSGKLVPEGIEGQVPYRGSLSQNLFQFCGGIRSGMGYVGASTILELQKRANFIKISAASLRENHPHDVVITKEAPNYQQN